VVAQYTAMMTSGSTTKLITLLAVIDDN
jgi:hypothetical protein